MTRDSAGDIDEESGRLTPPFAGRYRIELGYRHHFTHRAYDVLPDGQHFILIRDAAPANADLVIVDNWTSELATRLRK